MLEEGYALGFDPNYTPMLSGENLETTIALMALLAIIPNVDMQKLKIGIEAIEKFEKESK